MRKQSLSFIVPDKKIAKIEHLNSGDIHISFEEANFDYITTFKDAYNYLKDNNIKSDLRDEYDFSYKGSYANLVAQFRIVIAALTHAANISFASKENILLSTQVTMGVGKKIGVLKIGQDYTICGIASKIPVDFSNPSLFLVPSKKIADHIFKYFKDLFLKIYYIDMPNVQPITL